MTSRILIIEDDDFLRPSLARALREEDYEVFEAAAAEQALQVAKSKSLDLVIADVRLGAIDGLECLARIRRMQPRARSIVMTGYASEDAPTRAIEVEAEDYLYKPFELDDFLDAVEWVLESPAEETRYNSLLGTLVAGYRKLLDKAGAALASSELSSLDKPRDRAFHAFFVGVRSKKLGLDSARAVWAQLEKLEEGRQQLLEGELTLGRGKTLREGYTYVFDLAAALSRTSLAPRHDGPAPKAPVEAFGHLFAQIQKGSVSPEQVKQAPTLFSLDRVVWTQSQALADLRTRLWGQSAPAAGA
ncbi:MAG: response regulator [Vulcanimicrobiota bacterium]